MKIRPVEAELFHTDGRTDMKLTVAFRNFANALKNPTQKFVTRHYVNVSERNLTRDWW